MSQLNLKLITPPAAEPVTAAQAQAWLALDSTSPDVALLPALITAARQYAEKYLNRAIFNQTWLLTRYTFPVWLQAGSISAHNRNEYFLGEYWMRQAAIFLPWPDLQSVTSIQYLDVNNTLQTLDPSTYVVDGTQTPGIVVPQASLYWPTTAALTPAAVRVTYVAGSWGDGVEVNTCPATVVQAMLLLISHLYANREASSGADLKEIPFGVKCLLDNDRFECFDWGN